MRNVYFLNWHGESLEVTNTELLKSQSFTESAVTSNYKQGR